LIGLLSTAANSEERSSNTDTGGSNDLLPVIQETELTNGLATKSSESCPQRRKELKRTDAICNPTFDHGNPTIIDIIEYVHNNKKEKLTVIVNLLSDEMLSHLHSNSNEQAVGEENENNTRNQNDVLNKSLSPEVGCVRTEDIDNINDPLITVEAKTSYKPKNQLGNENASKFPQLHDTTKVFPKGKQPQIFSSVLLQYMYLINNVISKKYIFN